MGLIKRIIKPDLYERLLGYYKLVSGGYRNVSFSQEGEDLVISRLLEGEKSGFYVDVGAHHPFRFSNTAKFYKLGWHGINIDATPGSMKLFRKYRKADINIEAAIHSDCIPMTYFIMSDTALNGFLESEDIPAKYFVKQQIEVIPQKLSDIFENNILPDQTIDFLTIDVEGADMSVLRSNNWNKYKPLLILIEDRNFELDHLEQSESYNFLTDLGYNFVAKTLNTVFYKLANK